MMDSNPKVSGEAVQSDQKPTIRDALERFSGSFRKASQGSDINGLMTGTMLEFLRTENLPPYYRMKAYVVLSAADEEDEPDENLVATNHYLKKAREGLEECKRMYTHDPDDVKQLENIEKTIREEELALHDRERAFYSDNENDAEGFE